MQIRLIIPLLFGLLSTSCFASTTPVQDSIPQTYKNDRLLQVGVSYRSAVNLELQIPTVEVLLQPAQFFSVGIRRGQIRTDKLPELFEDNRGRMTGYVFRINIPANKDLDIYLEYAKMKGNLSFSENVFGLSQSVLDDRFHQASFLSGKVAFRQNQFQLGVRQHLGRYFFVDASVGVVLENYILEAKDVQNAQSAVVYFFDFVEELPPNEWHQNAGLRLGFTFGVRI